jgi:hypothetical protein
MRELSAPLFTGGQLNAICGVLAAMNDGLAGQEIYEALMRLGFDDARPQAPNKRTRLNDALMLKQYDAGSGVSVLRFIEAVMTPMRYMANPQRFTESQT